MIIRIVKMTFRQDKAGDFLKIFEEVKGKISTFHGCKNLELLQDKENQNIFFTYSIWDNEERLQEYRHSELFNSTWIRTKELFYSKAEAWTVEKI